MSGVTGRRILRSQGRGHWGGSVKIVFGFMKMYQFTQKQNQVGSERCCSITALKFDLMRVIVNWMPSITLM